MRSKRQKRNADEIDEKYGLEPVFEPSASDVTAVDRFVAVSCPYCGEVFETAVDLSAGSFRYVEDCQVCCQPIELEGQIDHRGRLVGLTSSRSG
jgi:hypothetical protein